MLGGRVDDGSAVVEYPRGPPSSRPWPGPPTLGDQVEFGREERDTTSLGPHSIPHVAGGRTLRPRGAGGTAIGTGPSTRSRRSALDSGVSSGEGSILRGKGKSARWISNGGLARNSGKGRGSTGRARAEPRDQVERQDAFSSGGQGENISHRFGGPESGVLPDWVEGVSHVGARVASTARGAAAAAAAARNAAAAAAAAAAANGGNRARFSRQELKEQEHAAERPSWLLDSTAAELCAVNSGKEPPAKGARALEDRPLPPIGNIGGGSGGELYARDDSNSHRLEQSQDAWERNQANQMAQRRVFEQQQKRQEQQRQLQQLKLQQQQQLKQQQQQLQQRQDLLAMDVGPATFSDRGGVGISSMITDQQEQSSYTLQLRQHQQMRRLQQLQQQQQVNVVTFTPAFKRTLSLQGSAVVQ